MPWFPLACAGPPSELPKAFAAAAAAAVEAVNVAVEVAALSKLWGLLEDHKMGCHDMEVAAAGPTI